MIEIKKNMQKREMNHSWRLSIGSGHAALALRKDYCKQLTRIQEDLGIQYVRFHGIFNDDMSVVSDFNNVLTLPGGEKFREISFHRCGLVYDNILECGLKPFVELSFMPELLAEDPSHGKSFYGSIMSKPASLDMWADLIRGFIRFLLKRYGEEEVSNWYFEVWNEPDLMGMFFKGTQEDYLNLYEVTARTIKEECNSLRVGGPATSGSKWVGVLRKHCKEKNIPLDFLSTHQYTREPFIGISDEGGPDQEDSVKDLEDNHGEEFSVLEKVQELAKMFESLPEDTSMLTVLRHFSNDPTEIQDMDREVMIKNSSIVKKQADGLPIFYTEWNLSASFGSYSNDTRKAAAYVLRTALKTDTIIDGSSIWTFSDIFEELHQFTEEFHGGFGLLTLNGIPKPSFYALKMLANAEKYQLKLDKEAEGDIEFTAFTGDKETQVLLYRQSLKQKDLPKEKIDIFVEVEKEPAAVWLERIDETHCNPLKIWEEAGEPADMTKAEVSHIQEKSAMVTEPVDYRYEDGIVFLSPSLGVNDIYFVRIVKGSVLEFRTRK